MILPDINAATDTILDLDIPWEKKHGSILITWWCLVEGIRFSAISKEVDACVNGHGSEKKYSTFFSFAETWGKRSRRAVLDGKMDPNIAVYCINIKTVKEEFEKENEK